MSFKASTPPPSPDPNATASAQTGTNIQSAIANATIGNANTVGPNGSTNYDITGNQTITGPDGKTYQVPRYTQTTTLSPDQQHLYDQQNQIGSAVNDVALNQANKIGGILNTPVDASGLPQRGALSNNDFSQDRTAVEKSLFDRINPQLDRDKAALETNLTNQGFQRGTEAWNNAMGDYGKQVNDLRLGITAQGLNEQQGLQGMDLNQAGFNNASRSQALNETLALRNQPINEITALQSGGQVSLPQAQGYNAPQMSTPDLAGLTTQAYQQGPLAQYQAQQSYKNAMMGGLFGLGGAAVKGATMWGGGV